LILEFTVAFLGIHRWLRNAYCWWVVRKREMMDVRK
jgi:hypothetical protein